MRRTAWLVFLAGCASSSAPHHAETAIDPDELRRALHRDVASRDELGRLDIESIRITPDRAGKAHYEVTRRDAARRLGCDADFPGDLLDAVIADGIAYQVRPDGVEDDPHVFHVDAASFHRELRCADGCDTFESIEITPLGADAARYLISHRDRLRPDVVYAEYPGHLLDEIRAAHIAYTVAAP
jgi:hypothetical protein